MKHFHYALDAPIVPFLLILGGCISLMSVALSKASSWSYLYGIFMLAAGIIYIHTSLRGKFLIWKSIINQLHFNGNEKVLDLGCGHGAVLIMFARQLIHGGRADGVDLWRNRDQSNNSETEAQRNIVSNHVQDRTKLITADMVSLPLQNNIYDYVVSGFAFHNIKPKDNRIKALIEACRVLKPNGHLIIVDTEHNGNQYMKVLKEAGFKNIHFEQVGFYGWWAGPWMGSYIVSGIK
jgi:arsenite methyltransferase